jgi:hypothetical protein
LTICNSACLELLKNEKMCEAFCSFSKHVSAEQHQEIVNDLKKVEDDVNELLSWAVKDVVSSKFEQKSMDDDEATMRLVEEIASVVAGTLAFHDEL